MIASHPIKDIWPVILPEIEALHRRFAAHLDWQPNDVFVALWSNRAFLFCNDDDGSFCVCKTKYRGACKILFIWIGCGPTGKMSQNLELAREIARNVGACRIEWESPRRGFDRVKVCQRGMTTYSMEA